MLRLLYASLKGCLKARRSPPNDPLAWESVLLSAEAILCEPSPVPVSAIERIRVAIMMLLSFDVYARGADLSELLTSQL